MLTLAVAAVDAASFLLYILFAYISEWRFILILHTYTHSTHFICCALSSFQSAQQTFVLTCQKKKKKNCKDIVHASTQQFLADVSQVILNTPSSKTKAKQRKQHLPSFAQHTAGINTSALLSVCMRTSCSVEESLWSFSNPTIFTPNSWWI